VSHQVSTLTARAILTTKQSKARQSKAKQGKARQSKAKQGKAKHCGSCVKLKRARNLSLAVLPQNTYCSATVYVIVGLLTIYAEQKICSPL
jgi:hypothetical protein